MAPVGSFSLRRTLPGFVGGKMFGNSCSAALERTRRVEPPQQFLQTGLDHRALGLGICAELLEAPPNLRLELGHAAVERGEPLVALALESLRRLGQSRLEPLGSRIADVREALREHALGFAREDLDCAVELSREAARSTFATRLDECRELLRRLLRMCGCRALDDSCELLDLPAFDVLEAASDPLGHLGFLARDQIEDLALASAQALVELVQRATPFRGMRVDLRPRSGKHLLE